MAPRKYQKDPNQNRFQPKLLVDRAHVCLPSRGRAPYASEAPPPPLRFSTPLTQKEKIEKR